jgi:phage terminase Nu1 subunit (DNA packaging protein)
MEVSTGDLAKVLGISARRIQQLADGGVFVRQTHGAWLLPDSVQAYLRHKLQGDAKRARKAGSGDDKLKAVKARREELRLARDERELVPLADALFAMDQVAGVVGLEVNNIPARFTRDLDERDRLQAEIDDVLSTVATRIAKCGASLRSDVDADPAEEEDDT